MKGLLASATIAAALALAGPAAANWRVVWDGMAVGEARSGKASLSAECLGDGLVLGVYEKAWPFEHAAGIDIVIDGHAYPVRQYGSGDRIVLSDADGKGGTLGTSPTLRAALKAGREARLVGASVSGIAPKEITFGLLGSEKAISTVEAFCR